MKLDILPYDLSILLIMKFISFSSIDICRSDKFFKINANNNSSSGLSIVLNIKFFVLDFKSAKEKLISVIGFSEVTIMYLLSISIILNKL